MQNRLIELISDAVVQCRFEELNGERLSTVEAATVIAEKLIEGGVTILPEGAIILTRAEIDALNKYEESRKNETR